MDIIFLLGYFLYDFSHSFFVQICSSNFLVREILYTNTDDSFCFGFIDLSFQTLI